MMNELETHSRPPVGQSRAEPAAKESVSTQLGRCLIVSTDSAKRDMLSLAATDAGWDTIVCVDQQQGMTAIQRMRFQLAWIDVAVATATKPFRELCQAVAALPGVLLVVCGHEQNAEEEIWARQLGVWLYLPGVSLEHASDISLVCEQAQLVAGNAKTSS
jgi:hypothetical protein